MGATVDLINNWFNNDEFKAIIVVGDHGYGKSSFAMQVCGKVYGNGEEINYPAIKNHIVFHPKDFLKRIIHKKEREPLIIWDDAGYWLNAMDFNNPFVKAVGKYLQVVRTDYGCIVFTCIDADDILKKVRGIPNSIMIKIIKDGKSESQPHRRMAKAYKSWKSPDGSRFGKKVIYADRFDSRMDHDFYFGWYKPLRDGYAQQAKELMNKHLDKLDY